MSMEFLEALIVPVIMAICLCIGFIIKGFKKIPNKWIPVILALLGVAIAIWESWGSISPEIIAGGLASGLAACGAYDTYKHFFGSEKNKDKAESEV